MLLLPTISTNKNDGRIPKIPEVPGALRIMLIFQTTDY